MTGFWRCTSLLLALTGVPALAFGQTSLSSQVPPSGNRAGDATADAITCWWRTSTAAVLVGEPFSLVLTCAVLDTNEVKVVPDESRLDSKAIQLPPFDILDGGRGPDFADGPRRFFQYRYVLRLLADNRFGKDVKLPALAVSYRIRSRSTEGALSEGRDQTYVLPVIAIRILSTVPDDAADIRDGGTALFEEIDARMFRGTALRAAGALCFGVAAVALAMTLGRVFSRTRGRKRTEDRQISAWLVHRGVARELSDVERERLATAWTPELVDRVIVLARLVAAHALSIPVTMLPVRQGTVVGRGSVVVPASWVRRRSAAASSSATAQMVADARAREAAAHVDAGRLQQLDDLERALRVLTQSRYGQAGERDEAALDEALAIVLGQARAWRPDMTGWLRNPRQSATARWMRTRLNSE